MRPVHPLIVFALHLKYEKVRKTSHNIFKNNFYCTKPNNRTICLRCQTKGANKEPGKVSNCFLLDFFWLSLTDVCVSLLFRFKDERPRHPVHCDYIQAVAQAVSIPVIAK